MSEKSRSFFITEDGFRKKGANRKKGAESRLW